MLEKLFAPFLDLPPLMYLMHYPVLIHVILIINFLVFYFYFVLDIKGDSLINQIDRAFTNTKLKESHKGSTKTLDTHKNSSYSQITPIYFITTCCK